MKNKYKYTIKNKSSIYPISYCSNNLKISKRIAEKLGRTIGGIVIVINNRTGRTIFSDYYS